MEKIKDGERLELKTDAETLYLMSSNVTSKCHSGQNRSNFVLENIHFEIHEMHSTADEICRRHLNILSVVKFKF